MRSLESAFNSPGSWVFKVGKESVTDGSHTGISFNYCDNWTGDYTFMISPSLSIWCFSYFISASRASVHAEYQLTAQETCSEHMGSECSNYIIFNNLRCTKQHTWGMNNIKITASNTAQALLPAIWTSLSRHPLPTCTQNCGINTITCSHNGPITVCRFVNATSPRTLTKGHMNTSRARVMLYICVRDI